MSLSVEVRLAERSYQVRVGQGILGELGAQVKHVARGERVLVLTNATVEELYGQRTRDSLAEAGYIVDAALVEDGEQAKSLRIAETVLERLATAGHERSDPIVALGGGVVGDLAGFVAGTYMRGVPFVQVPTTLLAQVDSSVGGKVAVNLPQGKNLVGLFWQPRLVLADVDTLDTLPARQVIAGMAEVVKTALIAGGELLKFVEEHLDALVSLEHDALVRVVGECVAFKAHVVEEDENDTGRRAILNLGHTVAHALEQQTAYDAVLHGEAVASGLVAASYVAEELGVAEAAEAERQRALVRRLGVVVPAGVDLGELIAQMYRDKKARGKALRFVLLARPGQPEVRDVPEEAVRRALARTLEGSV